MTARTMAASPLVGQDDAAHRASSWSQPDRGRIPKLAGVLPDRGQAFGDGAVRIGADDRQGAERTGVDSLGAGLLRGVLAANPARPGGSQQSGTRVGGPPDMGEHVRTRPARQRRSLAQVVVGQRLHST